MLKRIDEFYMVNAELFRFEFYLLFNNCFSYNSPKDKVYKEGQRIKQLIDKQFELKMEKLKLNAEMTIEE